MKFGLISDVHGNLTALNRALALLGDQDVVSILCAGDLVDGGKDGNEVVALIRSRSIPCVQGNHDQNARAEQAWIREVYNLTDPRIQSEFLSEATIAYLAELPLTISFNFDNIRLRLAHGMPSGDMIYLYPDSTTKLFEQAARDAQADIVVLGHTHMPMCKFVRSTWIVNPGSVDNTRGEVEVRQTCGVLELSPFSVQIFDINSQRVVRTCGTTQGS